MAICTISVADHDVCYSPTIKLREYHKTFLDVNDMKNLVVKIEEDGYVKEYAIDFQKFLKDYGIENGLEKLERVYHG